MSKKTNKVISPTETNQKTTVEAVENTQPTMENTEMPEPKITETNAAPLAQEEVVDPAAEPYDDAGLPHEEPADEAGSTVAESTAEDNDSPEEDICGNGSPVEESPVIPVDDEIEENPSHVEPMDKEADPLYEVPGDFYIKIGEDLSDEKLAVVEERLEKADLTHVVTASGVVLVGPYPTEEAALADRKKIIAKGLKGTIFTF